MSKVAALACLLWLKFNPPDLFEFRDSSRAINYGAHYIMQAGASKAGRLPGRTCLESFFAELRASISEERPSQRKSRSSFQSFVSSRCRAEPSRAERVVSVTVAPISSAQVFGLSDNRSRVRVTCCAFKCEPARWSMSLTKWLLALEQARAS